MLKGVDSPSLLPQVRMVRQGIYKTENTYAWQSQDYLIFRLCLPPHVSQTTNIYPSPEQHTCMATNTGAWSSAPHPRPLPDKPIKGNQISDPGTRKLLVTRGHFFCRENKSREEWRKQEEKRQACRNGASGREGRLEKVVGWSIYNALRICVKSTNY